MLGHEFVNKINQTNSDAQVDMLSAKWPQAQLVFRDLMVHKILQFTPSIIFHYILHWCESRDIRCQDIRYWIYNLSD